MDGKNVYITKTPFTLHKKIDKGQGRVNFIFGKTVKGKLCSVNGKSLTCLANLFFNYFWTTFTSCTVFVKKSEVTVKNVTLPFS